MSCFFIHRIALRGIVLFGAFTLNAQTPLPHTKALILDGDLSAQMVAGIGRFLEAETAASEARRAGYWRTDFSSRHAYEESVQPNRERLIRMIGAIDQRVAKPEMAYVATTSMPEKVAETDLFSAYAVRWPVLNGLHGEGLLLQPKNAVVARVIAITDADQIPEMLIGSTPGLPAELQYARRLVENGAQVIIPTLLDRSDAMSGSALINRYTNQPHREWIYRQAFELGRHVIGYEVEKILSAIDWMAGENEKRPAPIGVIGWGEGGLLALYSAAMDTRIDSVLVSGYFEKRERLWQEPIYRNLFGVLREFGDAEIARLVIPRSLIVEHARAPDVKGPPPVRSGRAGAAPGQLVTPDFDNVRVEVERAKQLAGPFSSSIQLHHTHGNQVCGPVAEATLTAFWQSLTRDRSRLAPAGIAPVELRSSFDASERQRQQVREMEIYTQRLLQLAAGIREEFLWKQVPPNTPEAWQAAMRSYREKLWHEIIGRFPTGQIPLNPRTRLIYDRPTWTGYEVVLDVLPDVFAWGYFLLPKGIKPGEKRPVVMVQHGLEGVPEDVMSEDPTSRAHSLYKAFARRLVERGFIVFAPHNPYRGGDLYRVLQRQANPLGKSLYSVIIAQHDVILDWLSAQPEVDARRIAFYGLSYGGRTAMRVPAVLERFALSISSGNFQEWIWKSVTTGWRASYMFSAEYEAPDFNVGMTFGDAEMAALIAPRPFMVERGHNDTVAMDEWVAFEYAKVRRLYTKLRIPRSTEIEYFDGPHTIHGVGTYHFLHRQLDLPEP
jgi:dienelactone hydrolase